MKKVKTLPVIFRIECDGNPLAVFPTLKEKADGMVTCYAHLGQHDKCCRGYYNDCTKPATKEQYKPLLDELTNLVGYKNLKVYKKWMRHYA